jgi:signal transduction histidine kinase
VQIAVQNEGPVIPPEQVRKLFQAMKRKRGETARDRRHLGLGLYIVEKIASAHGGSVDVQSTQQEGTMFTLRLPRR